MKFFQLTALAIVCSGLSLGFSSCQKDDQKDQTNIYQKSNIPVTGAQVAPAGTPTAGIGALSVSYDKRQKLLKYTISWSGLSDSVVALRINGPAPIGYPSLNPAFTGASPTLYTTSPYVNLQMFAGGTTAPFRPLYANTGSYTGTLAVDGVKVKEQDLLNGLYFITIHTKTILPGTAPDNLYYRWFGEIRGQIVWQ